MHWLREFRAYRRDVACEGAITYLASIQGPTCAWWGRWDFNYGYETSNVLCGLAYLASDDSYVSELADPVLRWLKSVQNTDGG